MAELDDDWRLQGLAHFDALGLRGSSTVQRIARLAAAIAGTRSAGVHILTDAVQARIGGHNEPLDDWPVQDSFCRLAVVADDVVLTTDATRDPRFAYSSHVSGPDPIRFYAAVPLRTDRFGPLGTLCVWHDRPQELDLVVLDRLGDLADVVVEALESQRVVDRLSALATTDDLTGLANRRQVEEVLTRRLSHARREAEGVAVAFIDLDGFKAVNDTHGHRIGDDLLVGVARNLEAVVRTDEVVGRLGGDEFVVIGGTGLVEGAGHGRFLRAIARPVQTGAGPVAVGASVGVAVAEDGETPSSLLHRADRAMFDVKRGPERLAGAR